MSRTIIDPQISGHWHREMKKLPGWWFLSEDEEVLIRVRRSGRGFAATVYENWPYRLVSGMGVVGVYRTVAAARDAAESFGDARWAPKLTTWRDVERDRKAIAELEAAKAEASA